MTAGRPSQGSNASSSAGSALKFIGLILFAVSRKTR
jgi:hypothetical protein